MFTGKLPSITPAQIGAVLTFVIAQVVAYGWVTNSQGQVLISAGGTLVAVAWKLADAFLRSNRAKAVAANPPAFGVAAAKAPAAAKAAAAK